MTAVERLGKTTLSEMLDRDQRRYLVPLADVAELERLATVPGVVAHPGRCPHVEVAADSRSAAREFVADLLAEQSAPL